MHVADDVHCIYIITDVFQNATKHSFSFDLAHTSVKIYHYRESMVASRITKGSWLSKVVGFYVALTFLSSSNEQEGLPRRMGF